MRVRSICPYCGVGCGIELEVKNKKVVKVHPQKDHPVSKGRLCIKGATIDKFINNPKRLKYPLIKKNDKFEKISWNKALDTVAKKLTEIKNTYGPLSIGIFSSTKCTNEENYIIQKFARVVIGTNNIDNSTRLCHATTLTGLYQILGKSAMTNSYEDLVESDCILIFGDNSACTQPIGFERILECKKHGGKIIVVDVRKTETAEKADLFLQINPNTDIVLVAGMIKIILEEKLEDKNFIMKRTKGYEEFLKSIENFTLKQVSKITGIKENKIREIALLYGRAKRAAIVYGMGITQQLNGIETVLSLADLALITGNFGRPGTGVNPLRGCNNVQGSCDTGCLPNVYPGYSSLVENTIKKFEKLWKVKNLPIAKGLTEAEMIEGIPERILAMYIIGANPMVSLPNSNRVEKNLRNLEFLIVQDVFLTETAKLADIILPSACFAEKTGTFTNTERRVQLIRKAVNSPGKAMEDWLIIKLLAERMGFRDKFNFNSSKEIFEEMRRCIPTYSGITYEKLEKESIQWPCNEKHPKGKRILYDKDFGPPGNKAVFYPISFIESAVPDHAYPIILTTHRDLEHYNTGIMTRDIKILNKIKSEAFVEISKQDAKRLGIKDGQKVKIGSPHGEIIIKAKISKRVKKGLIAVPNHYKEVKVNKLVGNVLDPISKTPTFKYIKVKVKKI